MNWPRWMCRIGLHNWCLKSVPPYGMLSVDEVCQRCGKSRPFMWD